MSTSLNFDLDTSILGDMFDNDVFAYQGFSPELTKSILMSIEKNFDVLHKDIGLLCYALCSRGSKARKMTAKMSEQGKVGLNALITKYKIIDSVPKTKEDITLARVGACFPVYCLRIMQSGKGRVVGVVPMGYPRELCFISAASIIPVNRRDLFELYLEWSTSFNRVVNMGKNEDKVEMYANIIWNANVLTEAEKKLALIRVIYS